MWRRPRTKRSFSQSGERRSRQSSDLYVLVRNYDGDIVAWRERTDSDKMRRRQLRDEFLSPPPDSESEAESPAQSPSPPPPKKPVKIVIEDADTDDEDTEAFNKSLDRAPSAKSVVVTPAPEAKHRSRVKDKFKPSIVTSRDLNKDKEAARLHRALHESGTDYDTVIEILTSNSHAQRKKISKAYKFNHNKVIQTFLY